MIHEFDIEVYVDARGRCPVKDFVLDLERRADTDKQASVLLNALDPLSAMLKNLGTRAGDTIVKHIVDEIWELRFRNHRILFFGWKGTFVLLHPFRKTTQKTPKREIERAKREISDWVERNGI